MDRSTFVKPAPIDQRIEIEERSRDITTTIAASSTEIVTSNPKRVSLWLINDSDEAIYLMFGRDAVLNQGIRLNAAGGALEINKTNLMKDSIYAICASGSKVISGIEHEARYASI